MIENIYTHISCFLTLINYIICIGIGINIFKWWYLRHNKKICILSLIYVIFYFFGMIHWILFNYEESIGSFTNIYWLIVELLSLVILYFATNKDNL